MRYRKIYSLLLVFLPFFSNAQQDVLSSGGDASSSSGSISYSIGQVVFSNSENASGSVNEGVQQPDIIIPINVVEDLQTIEVGLFPNPTRENVMITMPDFQPKLNASVFDRNGSLIVDWTIQSSQTFLYVGDWAAGQYILRITGNSGHHSEYKLIKQ